MTTTLLVDLSRRSGGAERRIVELCRSWSHTDELVVVHLDGAELGDSLRDVATCRLHALRRPRWSPLLVVDLVRLIRSERAQVVDAHNVVAQLWAVVAARLARVPRIFCTVHSDYRNEHDDSPRGSAYPAVLRLASWLGSRFVAVQAGVADFVETCGVSRRHIVVIPNAAVDPVATPHARERVRTELGIGEEFVVAFAGRLEPVKRVDALIRAFADDTLSHRDVRLVVAGDGSQRAHLVALVAELGLGERVSILGHRDDIIDVMSASDCVALVSSSEGLPYVVLEAAALGRPLVLTRLPALVDLLGDGGALFVDVDDHRAIAHAIADLGDDETLGVRLGRTATALIDERLPPAHLSAATHAAYLGQHRPHSLLRSLRPDGTGFDRAFATVRRVAPFVDRPTRQLSVLTYHRVADDAHDRSLDPVLRSATPEMFDEQMALVRQRHQPVSLDDVRAALVDGDELPVGAVLVTFDDAYQDIARHAAPVLRRHGIAATVFVPTAYPGSDELDYWWDRLYRAILHSSAPTLVAPSGTYVLDRSPTRSSWVANSIAHHLKQMDHRSAVGLVDEIVADVGGTEPWNDVMSWKQLEDFVGDGHTAQSHTRTHPALDQLPIDDVEIELGGSRNDLLERLGVAPVALAYPTGRSSPAVLEVIERTGYDLAFTTVPGANSLPVDDPLAIRRIDVTNAVRTAHLAAMLGPVGSAALRLR